MARRLPDIVPVSDLRQDAAAVMKRVRETRRPVVITQRGRIAAVLVDAREYERAEQERDILRQLARGEKEIARGEGHHLDDVLREADALLGDDEV